MLRPRRASTIADAGDVGAVGAVPGRLAHPLAHRPELRARGAPLDVVAESPPARRAARDGPPRRRLDGAARLAGRDSATARSPRPDAVDHPPASWSPAGPAPSSTPPPTNWPTGSGARRPESGASLPSQLPTSAVESGDDVARFGDDVIEPDVVDFDGQRVDDLFDRNRHRSSCTRGGHRRGSGRTTRRPDRADRPRAVNARPGTITTSGQDGSGHVGRAPPTRLHAVRQAPLDERRRLGLAGDRLERQQTERVPRPAAATDVRPDPLGPLRAIGDRPPHRPHRPSQLDLRARIGGRCRRGRVASGRPSTRSVLLAVMSESPGPPEASHRPGDRVRCRSLPDGARPFPDRRHDRHRPRPTASPTGFTIGSFTSVSLDPPLVGFLPQTDSVTWEMIEPSGRFCVNVLSAEQDDLCWRFAKSGTETTRFDGVAWHASPSGHRSSIVRWRGSTASSRTCTRWATTTSSSATWTFLDADADHDGLPPRPLVFFRGNIGEFSSGS